MSLNEDNSNNFTDQQHFLHSYPVDSRIRCTTTSIDNSSITPQHSPITDVSLGSLRLKQCSYCDYKTGVSTNLKRHMLSHTNDKPFPCPFCSYRATQKLHLQSHILTHTGEKPYHCTYCDHKTTRKAYLKQHILRYHPESY